MKEFLRNTYNKLFYGRCLNWLNDCNRILELGCGDGSLLVKKGITKKKKVVGIDIYQPHINKLKEMGEYERLICGDIIIFIERSWTYEGIVCMDVIEHLPKEDGIRLLENMKRWGSKIIVTTPNGFTTNYQNKTGNPYEVHRSSWCKEDFLKHNYKVKGSNGLKWLRKDGVLRWYVLGGILSIITWPIVRLFPEYACYLEATYENKVDMNDSSLYNYIGQRMLRGPFRKYVIDIVKYPLMKAIVAAGKRYPSPTKENTVKPNTHKLIDIRDKFFEYERNEQRRELFKAAFNILIVEYEHDGYYTDRFNWIIEKIKELDWGDRGRRPISAFWKEWDD